MQALFNEAFYAWHNEKKLNYILKFEEDYRARYNAVVKRNAVEKMSKHEYNWTRNFKIKQNNGTMQLYHKEQIVIKREEVFGILHEVRLGHAGRRVMEHDLQMYFGLSKEIVQIYLNLCEPCQLKKSKVKKSIVVKPIVSEDFNSRCQVDLIDLQARPDGGYKFIMDHLTKKI